MFFFYDIYLLQKYDLPKIINSAALTKILELIIKIYSKSDEFRFNKLVYKVLNCSGA